ncbi:hypothetical protein [Halorussus halophilus]|uniref:hypothetical protein n=1 Tax=Halorussus halophilus TaxID=2650975 RepID=UPI0013011B0E|nr:hypothetical protein [Halorussus halophilus]
MRRLARLSTITIALLVGVLHAAALFSVDSHLGYPVETFGTTALASGSFLAGLVLLGALPVFVSLRHRLVAPTLLFVLGAVAPVYAQLTGAQPEFDYLGGFLTVAGEVHVYHYVRSWYAWLLVYLLAGVGEYGIRNAVRWLPPARQFDAISVPTDRRTARILGLLVGLAHAIVLVWFSTRWHYFSDPGDLYTLLPWTFVGLVVLAGVPTLLLFEKRLAAPFLAFLWLLDRAVRTQIRPMPDDSLIFYFVLWFVFLGVALLAGGGEYAVRIAGRRLGLQSRS